MRTLAIALLTFAFALAADNPFVGTWKMDKSKSDFGTDGPKIDTFTIQYVQDGSTLKAIMTVNGTAEPAIAVNGEQHVTGRNRMGATHATPTAKGRMIETIFTKEGKKVGTRRFSLSDDGKVLTATTDAATPNGQKIVWTVVFDRQ